MRSIIIIIFLACLAACNHKMQPQVITNTVVKDSVVTNTVYFPKDSLIYLPGDTLEIYEAIPCPDAVFNREVKTLGSRLSAKVNINKGMLTVECKTDSLMQRITWLEKQVITERSKATTTTIQVPVEVIKHKTPKWCWLLLLAILLLTAWHYRHLIKKLI
jgi:hypothetical protein